MTLTVTRTLLVVIVCGILGTCGHSYMMKPTEIAVTDLNSGQPAQNLDLKVIYSGWLFEENVPQDATGRTNQQGKVVMSIAEFTQGAIHVKLGEPWAYYRVSPEAVRQGGEAVEQGDEPMHQYRVMIRPVPRHN